MRRNDFTAGARFFFPAETNGTDVTAAAWNANVGTPPCGFREEEEHSFSETQQSVMLAQCSCGSVELVAEGAPITSSVCYCDTCQKGSRRLDALPNAAPVLDADGGTAYTLYRSDRVRYTRGADLLRNLKLAENDTTRRMFADCCNAAMIMEFDDARHWVAVYRARFHGDFPPLEFRICTKYRTHNTPLPADVPSAAMYPFGLLGKLATSKIAMALRRP